MANLAADDTLDLAHWFLKGQAVGNKPLFDGICAFCGAWLHGDQNQHTALSNKCTGKPVDADGNELPRQQGKVQTQAQPPFLLRYSPQLFAEEAPEIFVHDENTNCLSLRAEVELEPWLRPSHSRHVEAEKTWLYCTACHGNLFQGKSRLPFRDRASQGLMKPHRRQDVRHPRQHGSATHEGQENGGDNVDIEAQPLVAPTDQRGMSMGGSPRSDSTPHEQQEIHAGADHVEDGSDGAPSCNTGGGRLDG